jgi:hypothetical protein
MLIIHNLFIKIYTYFKKSKNFCIHDNILAPDFKNFLYSNKNFLLINEELIFFII